MINIRKLKNGLPVVLEVMPQYRSASIGIYVKVGSAYENEKNNGISPTNKEIAEALNINEYQIDYALDSLKEPMSIFEPIYNDGGDTIYLFDQIADKKEFDTDRDMLISLRRALNLIKERERDVLNSRYILGKTQTELATEYNISQAQVSRIEKNAINSVKRLMK